MLESYKMVEAWPQGGPLVLMLINERVELGASRTGRPPRTHRDLSL